MSLGSSNEVKSMNPRQLAIQALTENNNKGNGMDAVSRLESSKAFLLAAQRDRNFARNLVSTTTRRLGQIDLILDKCCSSYPPKGKYGALLQACLRVGVTQLLFLETPAFAAVKETIDALKDNALRIPKPMVQFANAVLRRVDREGKDILTTTDVCDNISEYLRQEFQSCYGAENTRKIVEQFLDDSAHQFVDLSVNHKMDKTKIIAAFETDKDDRFHSVISLPNGSLRIRKNPNAGVISNWPLYDEGCWWVQDVASTLPAIALIKSLEKQQYQDEATKLSSSDFHVVDCCAAPGGKTAQLLSAGYNVTAIEASERRSRRLLENLNRLKFDKSQFDLVIGPGQEWLPKEQQNINVQGVLLDVPCSATGTGSKRPDVLMKNGDLGNLLTIQKSLANHFAENILQSGGIMVYATCSLLAKESEEQVRALLKRGSMVTLPFDKGEIPGFDDAIDENGWLRVLPGTLQEELRR